MRFAATIAVASLLYAVLISATPIPSEYEADLEAREFSNEDALFERATLGRAIRKAAKDTADIAAQKVYDIGTSGGSRLNRPSIFGGKKPSIPKPRPGGIRPIKFPSGGINAPKKPRVNFKAAWDAAKKKKSGGGRRPKPTRRPAKHVPRPGGHAGKPVMMPKKAKKGRK